MAGGRPTKYTDELLEIARAYPDNYNSEHGHAIPSVVGLCRVIGIRSETAYQWAKEEEKRQFSDILDEVMDAQHFKLMDSGLIGEFNSTISKLILAKHGHSDKAEVDQKVTGNHSHTHEVKSVDKFADILKDLKEDE